MFQGFCYSFFNLGSINLALLIKDGDVNWDKLKEIVQESVDFLDAVIDVSRFPLPQIANISKANRKIGLGVMGWADLLFQLKIPYASEEAVTLAAKLMEFIDFYAKKHSSELAVKKGAFPNFPESIYATGSLKREALNQDWESLKEKIKKEGIRNATLTTIAPTGTISMIADTSSGIEPQFSLAYVKNVMDGEKLIYVNKYLQKALEEKGIYNKKLLEEILTRGSLACIEDIPEELQKVFQTAHDISPEWHIRMQAAFQKYTDNAVSKTINFPNSATVEDIQSAYELAYHLGCKGVTVYRDGSRESQVLYLGTQITTSEKTDQKVAPRTRPEITKGITQRLETGCGHMYVTINTDAQGACEVFIQMGKVGGCASAQLEAIARLVSLALRSQIKIESITRQLKGIRCQSPMWNKGKMITSCGDAVGQALEQFVTLYTKGQIQSGEFSAENENPDSPKQFGNGFALCPDCGNTIEHTEGCLKCPTCGWSKC